MNENPESAEPHTERSSQPDHAFEFISHWIHKLSIAVIKKGGENLNDNIIDINYNPFVANPNLSLSNSLLEKALIDSDDQKRNSKEFREDLKNNMSNHTYGPLQSFFKSSFVEKYLKDIGYVSCNFLFLDSSDPLKRTGYFPCNEFSKHSIMMPFIHSNAEDIINKEIEEIQSGPSDSEAKSNDDIEKIEKENDEKRKLEKKFYRIIQKLTDLKSNRIQDQFENNTAVFNAYGNGNDVIDHRMTKLMDRPVDGVGERKEDLRLIHFLDSLGVNTSYSYSVPEAVLNLELDKKSEEKKFYCIAYINFNKIVGETRIIQILRLLRLLTPPSVSKGFTELIQNHILSHSAKAALNAIISRNHSHHIGSHIMPRSKLSDIKSKLKNLYPKLHKKRKFKIISRLKDLLDEYIQQKADFVAEVATAPLATTKSSLLFSQVIWGFMENSLLMDNIGANENVGYVESDKKNKLKIICMNNGKPLNHKFRCGICEHEQEINFEDYPYGGLCLKCSFDSLEYKPDIKNDFMVAWPGPLGEYALYAFLENFIRNSLKHNTKQVKAQGTVEIIIDAADASDLPGMLTLKIMDNITETDDTDLTKKINCQINKHIVHNNGQLRYEYLGVAEMKIMANLLKGSDRFLDISTQDLEATKKEYTFKDENGKVETKSRFGYEFKLIQARELAIISKQYYHFLPDRESLKKYGVWWFDSLESYKDSFSRADKNSRPAGYSVLIIADQRKIDCIDKYSHLFPYRTLLSKFYENKYPLLHGQQKPYTIDFNKDITAILESEQSRKPDKSSDLLIEYSWEKWKEQLFCCPKGNGCEREEGNCSGSNNCPEMNSAPALYFGQGIDIPPAKCWADFFGNQADQGILLFKDEKNKFHTTYKQAVEQKYTNIDIFDRHYEGWQQLKKKTGKELSFHQELDKKCPDFVPISCLKPCKKSVRRLSESSRLGILVLDERAAEKAYDEIDDQTTDNNSALIKGCLCLKYEEEIYDYRIISARLANIFIATHIKIDNTLIKIHESIKDDQYPRLVVSFDRKDNSEEIQIKLDWRVFPEYDSSKCRCCKITPCRFQGKDGCESIFPLPKALIIHQQVLETIYKYFLEIFEFQSENSSKKEDYFNLISEIKKKIPYLLVDSGRGIPADLHDKVKFLPFSLFEQFVLKTRIGKYSLTQILMETVSLRELHHA